MSELFATALQFPTIVFSIPLAIVLIYWLFVIVGALDIDLFHADAGDLGGAAKGIGDALGAAKGGAEGLKPDVDHGGGIWSGLGLGKVPITISFSVVVFIGWALSLVAMTVGPTQVGPWFPGLVLVAIIILAFPLAGLAVRPLNKVFETTGGKTNRDYIGHTCTITTGRVDPDFGQATIEDGGTVLVIAVRCDKNEKFDRGDRALLIDFDDERQAYVVTPSPDRA